MKQSTALKILKSGKNVFLTGSAGAGKTYLLNQYIQYLRERGIPLAITASTGIAATHLDGMTIHSWSGLGIRDELTDQDLEKIAKKAPTRKRIEKVKVLIIDEISMLSGQTLGCIDQILRYIKISFEPFGGIQVIFSGDFFQLPPVSRERKPSHERFAFMHPSWVEAKLEICYLTEQFRQGSDDDLLSLLNEIRSGEISDASGDLLMTNMEEAEDKEIEGLQLYTHNADVDRINAEKLKELEAKEKHFKAHIEGKSLLIEALKKSIIVPEDLCLKKGAQVIFVKNNYEEGYVNGTMGTVIDYTFEGYPIVQTFDDRKLIAKPTEWSIDDEMGKPIALFKQIPLRLAWAITVHKSQGMTLDTVTVDLSKTFEAGQGYVALSRVKNFDGLRLIGCNGQALQMDPLVMKADRRFQELAHEVELVIERADEKTLSKIYNDFILRCGGTLDKKEILKNQMELSKPKKVEKVEKISTYEKTKRLIMDWKTLDEIVEERTMTRGTIIKHIEKLIQENPDIDFSHVRPDEEMIKAVKEAEEKCKQKAIKDDYDKHGKLKVGLVHRALKGAYDYEDIRWAGCFA